MILYFSGTGNSQFVAKQISDQIKDDLVSINEYIKNNKVGDFKSEKPFVFVIPTYSWRMPRIIEDWLNKSSFSGNLNSYFILTCGGHVGNASHYAKDICSKKGFKFRGLSELLMPENYIALFTTPNEEECKSIIEKSKSQIQILANQIKNNEDLYTKKVSLGGKILSGPINSVFYSILVKDKGFTVSDKCISCGKCVKNCPLNNIELVNKKPVWKGNCTHCMACIGCCPVRAIEYKNGSKKRHRHYIMDESFKNPNNI